MKQYILNIVDIEDNHIYYTLLFNDIEECRRAKKLIENFDKEWYKYDKHCNVFEDVYYSEELLKMIRNNNIKCELPHIVKIYVR